LVDGIETPFYQGFPVILTQKLPLATTTQSGRVMIVFGDMYAGAVLGQRRGITLARSEHPISTSTRSAFSPPSGFRPWFMTLVTPRASVRLPRWSVADG
jgi:hypothetical protein